MGSPCRGAENHRVCPKTAGLIQFSDMFCGKNLHLAALGQRSGYSVRLLCGYCFCNASRTWRDSSLTHARARRFRSTGIREFNL